MLLCKTLRDDLLLLRLGAMQTRGLACDVRAEYRHVPYDGAALVVDAVDRVDACQQVVETRRTEQHLDRAVRIARRVHAQRLTCERLLRALEIDASDAELPARPIEIVRDVREFHVREVPAFDSTRKLDFNAADLGDDALRLCLLGSDGSGFRGRCRGAAKSYCYCKEKCGYVTDSRPDNGIPRRGAKTFVASSLPGKRHKLGRLTGFSDVRKLIRKPKASQTSTCSD